MPVPAMSTPLGVVYHFIGVVVAASWPSLEGLLRDLQLGRGGGRLRWRSSSFSCRVVAILLLEALSVSFDGRVLVVRWMCTLVCFTLYIARGCNKLYFSINTKCVMHTLLKKNDLY
jgi:hypothetical protein